MQINEKFDKWEKLWQDGKNEYLRKSHVSTEILRTILTKGKRGKTLYRIIDSDDRLFYEGLVNLRITCTTSDIDKLMYISNGVGRKSVAVVEFSKDTLSYEMQKTDSKWTDESEHLTFGKFRVSKKSDEIFIKDCDIPLIHLYAEPVDQSIDYAKKLIQKRINHYKEDPEAHLENDNAVRSMMKEATNYNMRIVNHYQCGVKLPITQLNGNPFDFTSIQFSDCSVRIGGYAGGPYAAFSVNIDIDEDHDDKIDVYDTKHRIDYTGYFNRNLILEFLQFYRENINVREYLHQPTNTGMVMLSAEDTDKLRKWASSHKFKESAMKENWNKLFDNILNENVNDESIYKAHEEYEKDQLKKKKEEDNQENFTFDEGSVSLTTIYEGVMKESGWTHSSGYVPHDGNGMVGGRWASSSYEGEYEKEVIFDYKGKEYTVTMTLDAELDGGYDDSVNYSWSDIDIDEDSIQIKSVCYWDEETRDFVDVENPDPKIIEAAKKELEDNKDHYFENDWEQDEHDYPDC